MVGSLYGGTNRQYSKYNDFTPDYLEMAILAQNATDQFTDPALMALNSEDAMERFQLQLMKTSTPETRIPSDIDKTLSNRKRARELINLVDRGGPRGPTELAYKPELVQSNRSTYTYEVPSTDPVVARRDKGGTYHSTSSGNTVYRMALPNNQTNAEISNKMFNFSNNRAKYAAARNWIENTSQMVDFIPDRKDRLWEARAMDETRKRLMPKIEIYTDNGDNINREKNKCRDTERVAYKYRHKEYDVNRELHEVLDLDTRVRPEIGPRESDGTAIGNLVAQLSKKGLGYAYIEQDIENLQTNKKYSNPNRGKSGKIDKVFDNTVHSGLDDKDGKVNDFRPNIKVETVVDNAVKGLDNVTREIVMGEVIDEIKRSSKKTRISAPRKTKYVTQGFDSNGHNVDDDANNENTTGLKSDNKYNDTDRDVLNYQVPILTTNFKKEIAFVQSNPKINKANTSGQKRGYTINDTAIPIRDDEDNDSVNRTQAETLIEKTADVGQGVRGLINDLVPDMETNRSNDKINPNRRIVHAPGGKIVKFAVNNSELFDKPDPDGDNDSGKRKQVLNGKHDKRPFLPNGITIKDQTERIGRNKGPNKKRKTPNKVRDDGMF